MTGAIDIGNAQRNGVRFVDEGKLDALDGDARAQGYLVRRIDLADCRGKHDLLRRIASALAFPGSFGMNWDALADCLGDLAWLPPTRGHAWLFEHAEDLRKTSKADFDTLRAVLDEACARWKDRHVPCFAFLALADG